jgi:hypothetical protein
MTEQVLNGFEIYYPAQTAMLLSWIYTDPWMAENQKKAESLDCSVYAVKDGSNEYILIQEFKIYHVSFNREGGSCSCKGFTSISGTPATPCEHIIKMRSLIANHADQIKPLSSRPGLTALIEKYCKMNGAECRLPPEEPKKSPSVDKTSAKAPAKESAKQAESPKGSQKMEIRLSQPCREGMHKDCCGFECRCDCHQKGSEKLAVKQVERPGEKKEEKLPANQELARSPGKKKSDAEIDVQIEEAKAERFLQQRGSQYKVQGRERPDSHMIQKIANKHGISVELIEATQTDDCAHIVVRGHLNGQYVDAVVHHDFKTEYQLKVIEIVSKNPDILDHWEGTEPVIKDGAKIKVNENGRDVLKDAKYFIVHALLSFKKFALRDGRTKAAAIAEAMLLNQDFREPEERESEEAESRLVQETIENRIAAKVTA